MSFTLDISNLHWLGEPEEHQYDLCLHGTAYIKIGNEELNNLDDNQLTVSAGLLRLLRSLYNNHIMGDKQHLMPCCGYFLIPSKSLNCVKIYGCPRGIDWTVLHYGDKVKLITKNDTSVTVNYDYYKDIIIKNAEKIEQFYLNSPKKIFAQPAAENDKRAYCAFWNEWHNLRFLANHYKAEEYYYNYIDFSKYWTLTISNIVKISKAGVIYRFSEKNEFIDFEDCAKNFATYNNQKQSNIVGFKINSPPELIFYTSGKLTKFTIKPKNNLSKIFRKTHFSQKLNEITNQISNLGWQLAEMN